MFKTNQANIAQIKATIDSYGECWFHGCGNIYVGKDESDFRKNFTNPNSEESIYRVHFSGQNEVPGNVKELNELLMKSRNQELIQEKMPASTTMVKTISVAEGKLRKPRGTKPPVEEEEVTKVDSEGQ
jgi:hypothetical protein